MAGINHSDFSERLGKANKSLDRQYDEEGDKTPFTNQYGKNLTVQEDMEIPR